jgi:uncharacterized protein YukE
MSESQVHNDPDRLRAFAVSLNQFAASSDELLSRLKTAVGHLGQTWRDQEFEKFVQVFATAQTQLRGFVDETRKVTPALEDDARKLEDYLKLKMNG